MASLKSLVLAACSLAGLPNTVAMINSMNEPLTATVGQTLTVTFNTSIYIQNHDDFGIIWGLSRPQWSCENCVGRKIGYTDLVGNSAPKMPAGAFTVDVTVPDFNDYGSYTLVAGVPFLVGASGLTGIRYFNSTIEVSASP